MKIYAIFQLSQTKKRQLTLQILFSYCIVEKFVKI